MKGPLAGRHAVVSGASRGIGLAIAQALGAAGCRVAMVARSADVLRQHANAIDGALSVPCDLGDRRQVSSAVETIVREHRPGDLVVIMSNGGFGGIHRKLLKALA